MRSFLRIAIFMAAALAVADHSQALHAQQLKNAKEPAGSIAGRVTLDGKPAANIAVMLMNEQRGFRQGVVARVTTDEDGRFHFTRIPAGKHIISAFAPSFVNQTEHIGYYPGKTILLEDGEAVEGINIALVRGGVIAGRVTDSNGSPIAEERIILTKVDEHSNEREFYPSSISNYSEPITDDRGMYRIYGLSAGRYKVSVGLKPGGNNSGIGYAGGTFNVRTYHPGVTDEAQATILEVTPGSEVSDADIVAGRRMKLFVATGRIIDADTRQPARDMPYGFGRMDQQSQRLNGYTTMGARSGPNGEFRIEGLLPGQYAAGIRTTEPTDYYGEPAVFNVVDNDLKGLEIKVRRGSSISGFVVQDGGAEAKDKLRPDDLWIGVINQNRPISLGDNSAKIGLDGSFHITGIAPGKVNLWVADPSRGSSLPGIRIEQDGAEMRGGLEVTAGENITGVKVFIAAGVGSIRGIVKIEGGDLPVNSRIYVNVISKTGERQYSGHQVDVDERGRFVAQYLPAGEYEVQASISFFSRQQPVRAKEARKTVTVTSGVDAEVNLVVELEQAKRPRQ